MIHKVTIFERNDPELDEIGVGSRFGPNGSNMAVTLGLTKESLKAVMSNAFQSIHQHDLSACKNCMSET